MKLRGVFICVGAVALAASLSGCAATSSSIPAPQYLASPEASAKQNSDPNEQFNRQVFESNQKFNHDVLYPMAKAYNENVPEDVRDRMEAFSTNLKEPVVFANDVLQLRLQAAATTLARFAINSTLGLGGLFDVAATQNLSRQSGDFGQTLYVWGVRDSPYVILPFVGPTNVRDAIGGGIEFAVQIPAAGIVPTQYASLLNTINTIDTVASPLNGLSKAEDMQTLEDSSIDFYSSLRSFTEQKRQAELDEAIASSALTGQPSPSDPYAIEPTMEIASSPTLLEKRRPVTKSIAVVRDPGMIVEIGTPTDVH